MKPRPLTTIPADKIEKALELRSQGAAFKAIGQQIGFSKDAVRRALALAENRRLEARVISPCQYDERVRQVLAERPGLSDYAVGKVVGCHKSVVQRVRLHRGKLESGAAGARKSMELADGWPKLDKAARARFEAADFRPYEQRTRRPHRLKLPTGGCPDSRSSTGSPLGALQGASA